MSVLTAASPDTEQLKRRSVQCNLLRLRLPSLINIFTTLVGQKSYLSITLYLLGDHVTASLTLSLVSQYTVCYG